jgi:transposase
MEDLLEILDENIMYEEHEIIDDKINIYVTSKRNEAHCPYCKKPSSNVHSRTNRSLKDLPIQGKKVILKLESKKYFCKNLDCAQTTFSERFSFFEPKATKTNRLQDEILRVSLNQSSITASRYLRKSVADVGKSTICNLLKKGHTKCG